MSKDTGGPAFPICENVGNMEDWKHGMTLRDYFAAKAMSAAIIAAGSWGPMEFLKALDTEKIAQFSDKQADAMLAERSKP